MKTFALPPSPLCELCGRRFWLLEQGDPCGYRTNPLLQPACMWPENEVVDWTLRVLMTPSSHAILQHLSFGTVTKTRELVAESRRLLQQFRCESEARFELQFGPYCPAWRRPRPKLVLDAMDLEVLYLDRWTPPHQRTEHNPELETQIASVWERVLKHLLEQCCERVQMEFPPCR